jgi:LacI family transcriptional regulator
MKVTMKQIAGLSGVSIATVSKVINNKDGKISQETRDRIRRIVKEQGYVANRIASSMVTKRTKTLGLVIPDIANPFFPDLARGVEDGANKLGYTLILCNSDNDLDKEEAYLEMLQEKMVDGIIFTASGGRKTLSPGFKHLLTPVVCVDREIEGLTLEGKIVVDNHRGAMDAVSYLLSKDYRKIVHLSGPLTSKTAQDRYQGFLRAHQLLGVEPRPEHLYEGTYSSDWGFRATRQLIDSKFDFDCLFCGNDLIALGAYKALHEAGMRIPQDIGVIGFDDIYMAQIVTPELTTVRQPAYAMGYEASLMLIKSIRQEAIAKKELVLPTELIVRGSTR